MGVDANIPLGSATEHLAHEQAPWTIGWPMCTGQLHGAKSEPEVWKHDDLVKSR